MGDEMSEELITEATMYETLRKFCYAEGSQKGAAAKLGISQQFLSDVLSLRRSVGPTIAWGLGYEPVRLYRRRCDAR